MCHCNIIPSDLPKWVFLEQTEMVFSETKTIFQWKWCSGRNGTTPTGHKYTKKSRTRNPLKVLATPDPDLYQNRKRLFIKALIPCSGTQGTSQKTEHLEQPPHTNRSQINTPLFVTWLKPSRGN